MKRTLFSIALLFALTGLSVAAVADASAGDSRIAALLDEIMGMGAWILGQAVQGQGRQPPAPAQLPKEAGRLADDEERRPVARGIRCQARCECRRGFADGGDRGGTDLGRRDGEGTARLG